MLNTYRAGRIVRQLIAEEADQFTHHSKLLSQLQLELNNSVISQILAVGKKVRDLFSVSAKTFRIPVTDNQSKSENTVLPTSLKTRNDNIPGPTSAFTGREDILKELADYFNPTTASVIRRIQRVFVLWGLGGSGKTQIALKFASMQYDQCVVL